jgi:hypothetical protein
MHFSIGNAVKYLWRFRDKGGIEDLKKARWYLDDHIKHLESKEPTIHRVYEGERIWEPRLDYALPAGHWRCAVKNFEDDSTQLQQFFFIENVNTLLDGIKQFMPNLGWTDFKIVWIERIK